MGEATGLNADRGNDVPIARPGVTINENGHGRTNGTGGDIVSIVWDIDDDSLGNTAHVAEHGLTPDEVDEVLLDPLYEEQSHATGRPLRRGLTSTGRFIAVVFEWIDETGGVAYPVTAYDIEFEDDESILHGNVGESLRDSHQATSSAHAAYEWPRTPDFKDSMRFRRASAWQRQGFASRSDSTTLTSRAL